VGALVAEDGPRKRLAKHPQYVPLTRPWTPGLLRSKTTTPSACMWSLRDREPSTLMVTSRLPYGQRVVLEVDGDTRAQAFRCSLSTRDNGSVEADVAVRDQQREQALHRRPAGAAGELGPFALANDEGYLPAAPQPGGGEA
jgi:hypothetical protein